MPHRSHILLSGIAALALAAGVACWVWLQPSQGPISSHPHSAIPNPKSLPLLPVVEKIVREGPQIPYLKFNFLIKELPLDLTPQDIDALIAFISGPKPPAFQDGEWGSLVNDIEECLTVQTVPSEKVAHALIAIYRDESKIQMQRDYALQHIGGFLIYLIHTSPQNSEIQNQQSSIGNPSPSSIHDPQSTTQDPSSSPQSPIPNLQSLLLSELKTAASDTTKPWSGTALNLLDGSLRAADYRTVDVPGLNAEILSSLAIPAARNTSAPLNARIPGLQVAARLNSSEALDLARSIIADPASPILLVQAAAATISQLGSSEDLALLTNRLSANEKHARSALNQAIQKLSSH
jgi:hypothetical protein